MVDTRPPEAITRWLIESETRKIAARSISQLDGKVSKLSLSNNRLNSLVQSVAWHQQRQEANERLAELERELDRLSQKAEPSSPDAELYRWLSATIGAGRTEQRQRQRDLEALENLWSWFGGAQPMHDEFDLRLAEQTMQIILTLVRVKPLESEIEASGGKVAWQ